MQPWAVNDVISCGGVVVRPGDAIIGDNDGVVVVPALMAERVLEIAAEREEVEQVIKRNCARIPAHPASTTRLTTTPGNSSKNTNHAASDLVTFSARPVGDNRLEDLTPLDSSTKKA